MLGTMPGSTRWFGVWVVLGAVYALALLGAASIGVLFIPVAVMGTAVVVTRPGARAGVPGLVSGLGVPLLCRFPEPSRPGDSLYRARPWPWAGVGVALIIVGAVAFNARRTTERTTG